MDINLNKQNDNNTDEIKKQNGNKDISQNENMKKTYNTADENISNIDHENKNINDNQNVIRSEHKDGDGGRYEKNNEKEGNKQEDRKDSNKIILDKKENKNFFNNSLVTILLILAFSVVAVGSYLPIRNSFFDTKNNVYNYIQSDSFANKLVYLTQRLHQTSVNSNERYYDSYINTTSIKYKISNVGEEQNQDTIIKHPEQVHIERGRWGSYGFRDEVAVEIAEDVKEESVEFEEKVDEEFKEEDIETSEIKDENHMITSQEEINQLTFPQNTIFTNIDKISDTKLQEEKDNSLMYIRLVFDENGLPTVESKTGQGSPREKFVFNEYIFLANLTSPYEADLNGYKNLQFEYIIPPDFAQYEDVFTNDMKEHYAYPGYLFLILIIGAVSILLLTILTFAEPYRVQSKKAICRGFNIMFLELKIFTLGIVAGLYGVSVSVVSEYSYSYIYYANPLTRLLYDVYDVNAAFYGMGIPLTFVTLLFIYLNIVYIKYIYYEGFKKGVIDNSFIGKIILYTIKKAKEIIEAVMTIDLREDNYRRLVAALLINLVVMLVLGQFGFVGLILALGYSWVVLQYFLKILNKAKVLNDASGQVAEGNFDIQVDEDMGILSPMAQNLNNIKHGFSIAIDREIKSERMKAELISNVSHDLKTPLTSIITYVDLLKKEDTDVDTQKEYIDIIDRKSQRLKVLIEDLFEASKATSGNIEFNLENIDVIALLRQTLGELEEKINESNLQFKINAPEGKVTCNLDGRRTYRVFENIISNILKYSMENSRVYIDVLENGHKVSFIFKNISAYEMNFEPTEITERFTRGDESRTTEGSGLGLSIAKSFVEHQGGSLDIAIDGDLFKLTLTFPKV